MLKALEEVSATKKRLKIEIPSEAIESEIQRALRDAQKRSRIPGFRPGKAPMSFIERKFGKNIESEVLEKIIPDHYMEAVKEAQITPVARPVLEQSFDFKPNTPLSVTFTVETRPNIENLSYEGLTINESPVKVEDGEIEALLQNIAAERATYESVDDAIKSGDLITIDYTVRDDGTVAKDVVLKVGSSPFPQEFFDGLIGREKDQEVEIVASFPDDSSTPFAGKRPKFEVRISDIKRRNAISVDDDFAKDLGLENLAVLREKLRERVYATKKRDADSSSQMELLDKLVARYDFEVPETLLATEIEEMIGQLRASKKDERADDVLMAELRPKAEKNVRRSILLEIIGEKEGITVSDDEVQQEILTMAQRVNISPEDIVKYYIARDGSLYRLKHAFSDKKVLTFLLSKATIEKGEEG
ncbi:MAG: trigger factor [Dissulfurispiraceae bacterium]